MISRPLGVRYMVNNHNHSLENKISSIGIPPLVTVIIPVFNTKKYLERCIDSVLNQTLNNLEVILIDDGSTDGSEIICDEYANIDSRVTVIHQNNSGVSVARNAGLNIATGAYITFIDSDDAINPGAYQLLNDEMEPGIFDVISFNSKKIADDIAIPTNPSRDIIEETRIQSKDRLMSQFLINQPSGNSVCNKLFKSVTIKGITFDTNVHNNEDKLFFYKVLKKSIYLIHKNVDLYYYFLRHNSASTRKFNSDFFSIELVADYIADDLIELMPQLKEEANIMRLRSLIELYTLMSLDPTTKNDYESDYIRIRERVMALRNLQHSNYSIRIKQLIITAIPTLYPYTARIYLSIKRSIYNANK